MPHLSGTLLDRALPSWHVVERHARTVAADLATTWRALGETPVRDLRVSRLLLRVRALGSRRAEAGGA